MLCRYRVQVPRSRFGEPTRFASPPGPLLTPFFWISSGLLRLNAVASTRTCLSTPVASAKQVKTQRALDPAKTLFSIKPTISIVLCLSMIVVKPCIDPQWFNPLLVVRSINYNCWLLPKFEKFCWPSPLNLFSLLLYVSNVSVVASHTWTWDFPKVDPLLPLDRFLSFKLFGSDHNLSLNSYTTDGSCALLFDYCNIHWPSIIDGWRLLMQ